MAFKYFPRFLVVLATCSCLASGSFAKSPVQKIETAIFADAGHVRFPKISPDGSRIIYREQIGEQTYLATLFLDGTDTYRVAMPEDTDLLWYRWAGSKKMLFSVASLKSYGGFEFRQVEIYVIDLETRKSRYLGPAKAGPDGDNVLYVDPEGAFLLMSVRQSAYKYPSVFRVNIDTNESEEIVKDQLRIWRWFADNEGVVRAGVSYRRRSSRLFYRSQDGESFKRIAKFNDNDDEDEREEALIDVDHIFADRDDGYILSNKETGRFALYKYNFLTRETGEMVFGHDENDISSFHLNEDGTALESVRYTDSRDRIKWFDPSYAKHQNTIDKALAGREAWIASKNRDGSKMIIYSTSPTDPGSYYLYEPAERRMERLAGVNDKLKNAQLSETTYEKYRARDGMEIPAYVTLPEGRDPKNLPLIIMPHGGPFGVRDTLDFYIEVQFFANRGYAVLQPNFRGSGSYGEKFYEIGEGAIGRAMQDDLDDGMDWLVERGIVDPKRVCIVGSSYGGYAALWGVTRNPERYRCAASYAGVTDWNKQLRYDRSYLSSRYRRDWMDAVRGEDDLDLDDVSPVRNADKLIRPVLLAHGEKDSRVPFSQYELYKDKLKNSDADVTFVSYEDEGHGFSDPKNLKDWLDQLDKFLAKQNPAD